MDRAVDINDQCSCVFGVVYFQATGTFTGLTESDISCSQLG